jgi:argininosuccinate lyase
MVATLTFHTERMAELAPQGFSLATDVAEWLVKRHVSFRDAHEITGLLVKFAETNHLDLHEVSDEDLQSLSVHLVPDVREVLTIRGSVESRDGAGGTAPVRVAEQRAHLVNRVRDLTAALGR